MSMPEPRPKPRGVVAVALIIVGLMILVPSGLCTSLFAAVAIITMVLNPINTDFGMFLPALVIGGPFVALGAFLVWLGWRRPRR